MTFDDVLRLAVIGAGGHGRVVLHTARSAGIDVVRLTDRRPERFPDGLDGCPVCSDEELLEEFSPREIRLALGVGSTGPIGSGHVRRAIVNRLMAAGYVFPPLIHAAAWVAESASLGQGVQIHAGAVVQPGSVIGDFSIINTGARVDHDCRLGSWVHAAPGATLSGDVEIREGTHVGTGASVIQGVRIGRECLIAAGAVVVNSVGDEETVAGVPARPLTRG